MSVKFIKLKIKDLYSLDYQMEIFRPINMKEILIYLSLMKI